MPILHGAELVTNKELALQEEEKWSAFFADLQQQARSTVTKSWLAGLAAGTAAGYRTMLALYREDGQETRALLETCADALDRLVDGNRPRPERLPVFAASLSGDPHCLDPDKPLGRLFFYALHHLFDPRGLEIGQQLEERYGTSFQPWFFDTETYLQAPKGSKLSREQGRALAGLQVPWDSKLIATMLRRGEAVYQEVLTDQIIRQLQLKTP